MAGLDFKATLDNADFKNKLMEMQTSLAKVSQEVAVQGANMENTFNGVRGSVMDLAAQFGIGFGAVNFVKQVAQVRGQFQALEQSFKTLLRSEEDAKDLMAELTRTAATTPFDLQGVAGGAKQLLAYGVAAKDVNKTLVELGDIASGMGLSLSYITQLYGTTISKDAMDTMDLKQFKGQGIAIDEAIAAVMKVEKQDVPALISQHKVTSDIVKMAISNMAGEDGQFGGMMVQQSKTILGQISNLEDAIDTMFNNIGQQTEGVISDVISAATSIVENYEEIGKQIAELTTAYGAYKASLIAITAYQGSGAKAELEMLRELTQAVEEEGDAELEALVKKGALTDAEAAEIIALRAEITAKEAEAQATFNMAKESKASANAAVMEAEAQLASAKAAQQAAEWKIQGIEAAQKQADAEEAANLAKELDEAISEREAAAQAIANAEKNVAAARSAQVAASEQVEAAQRNVNTISMQRQTIAQKAHASMTNLLIMAQKGLKKALDATGLSMLANPYVAAAAAIAAVGYAIYKVTTYTSDFEKAQKRMRDSQIEATDKADAEKQKLENLMSQLQKLNKESDEYKNVKQKIVDQYGKYSDNLSDEIDKTTSLVNVHRALAQAIQDESDVKAYTSEKTKIEDEYQEGRTSTLKNIYGDIQRYYNDDVGKTEDFYKRLQKVIKDGSLKVENSYVGGVYAGSQFIVDKNNEDAKEVERIINDMQYSSFAEKSTKGTSMSITARVGELFTLLDNRQKELEEAKNIFNIDDAKLNRVNAVQTRQDSRQNTESAAKEELGGLEQIIKQIREKESEYTKMQTEFRNGIKHRNAQGTADVLFTAQDLDDAQKKLNELKSAYEKATNIKWDDRHKNAQSLSAAQEAGLLLTEEAEKNIIKKDQEFQMKLVQSSIDSMNDGFEKRRLQRMLNNQKEINDIYAQAEEEKKAATEAAKSIFEQEQDVKEKQAVKDGNRNFKREQFSVTSWRDSQEAMQQFAEIESKMYEQIAAVEEVQSKKEQESLTKDLAERTKFYEELLAVQNEYVKSEVDLRKQLAAGLITEDQYNTMMELAKQKRQTQLDNGGFDQATIDTNMQSVTDTINYVMFGTASNILDKLKAALLELQNAEDSEQAAVLMAQINALKAELEQQKKKGNINDPSKFIKAWNKYGSAIKNVTGRVNNLTRAFAENGDKSVEVIADVTDGIFSIFDSISELNDMTNAAIEQEVALTETSVEGMNKTAEGGSKAMQAVEKASVILAIIAAAYQIIMKISEMIKTNDQKYDEAAAKQAEINALTLAVDEYEQAVRKAKREENQWFSKTGLDGFVNAWNDAADAMDNYYTKANEQQVEYQDKAAGGWLKKAVSTLAELDITHSVELTKALDPTKGIEESAKKFEVGYKKAIENLRIETRASSKGFLGTGIGGKSQQTQDLRSWVKENYGYDLFNGDDLDVELAKKVIDQQGDKLQGETKQTLEELVKYQDQVNSAMESMKEYVSEMYSPLVDNMVDALFDWLDTGEDVMDKFEEYASDTFRTIAQEMTKQLVQDMVFGDAQDRYMQAYKDYAAGKFGDVGSEGALKKLSAETTAISANVKDNFEKNAEGLKTFTQAMSDTYEQLGIDIKTANDSAQEATYGGYETMSEQTGTELSGRFSAMYIVQSEHLSLAQNMLNMVGGAYNILAAGEGVLEDMRALQVQSTDHLSSIASMTRQMFQNWNDRIENIEKYTKTLS